MLRSSLVTKTSLACGV